MKKVFREILVRVLNFLLLLKSNFIMKKQIVYHKLVFYDKMLGFENN